MRVIFFTGKGGVGKSTMSCATGAKIASMGKKVVIASLDLAHNLKDIFGSEFKNRNIHITEFDPDAELKKRWSGVYRFLKNFIEEHGIDDFCAEEMILLPGMDEVLFFLSLLKIIDSDKYDVLIVDGPPTASSLKFLTFPETLKWYKNRFFSKTSKRYLRVKPLMEKYFYTPLPDKDFIDEVEIGYEKILTLHSILKDPSKTSFRIVTIPSEIVLNETIRLHSVLSLFEYPVDGIIVNKLSHHNGKILENLISLFSPLCIMKSGELEREPIGFDAVKRIGDMVYKGVSAEDVLTDMKPFKVIKGNGSITIEFFFPGTKKEDIEMWIDEEELIIKSGAFKRVMVLKGGGEKEVKDVNFSDGWLRLSILRK